MRQTITKAERNYCKRMNAYYDVMLSEMYTEGRTGEVKYTKYQNKLKEWGAQLNSIKGGVSGHK